MPMLGAVHIRREIPREFHWTCCQSLTSSVAVQHCWVDSYRTWCMATCEAATTNQPTTNQHQQHWQLVLAGTDAMLHHVTKSPAPASRQWGMVPIIHLIMTNDCMIHWAFTQQCTGWPPVTSVRQHLYLSASQVGFSSPEHTAHEWFLYSHRNASTHLNIIIQLVSQLNNNHWSVVIDKRGHHLCLCVA